MDDAVDYAIQIAEGLAKAHSRGIIHRDIKPANILVTEDGVVKIVDFGLAKLAGRTMLTKEGTTLGTVAYMSPEQTQGTKVDHRTDIWAFGVVLYEMLTGQQPFKGDYEQAVIYSIMNEDPVPAKELRADLPEELSDLIMQTLSKDREQRIRSASELLQALEPFRAVKGAVPVAPSILHVLKRPAVVPILLLVLVLPALFYWLSLRGWRSRQNVAELLPAISQAAAAKDYVRAYELAMKAGESLANDSTLQQLQPLISNVLTILSEPEGAAVYLKSFRKHSTGDNSSEEYVGKTPIRNLRVARDDYFIRIEKEGYIPVERIASTEVARSMSFTGRPVPDVLVSVQLRPTGSIPEDMVQVPGGPYQLVGAGAPTTKTAELKPYRIDKYEVSNRHFKEFILAGGYTSRSFWKHPFVKNGQTLSWDEAMRLFTDRTGLPGPRTWVNQEFPAGQQDYPVSSITWYEAAAYAEFVGKRLPTLFEWEKAARNGEVSGQGAVMPWGLVRPGQSIDRRANFNGQGALPVNSFEFGISPYGCYNMAGNVKEWCANPITGGYVATGGSWHDPIYLFMQYGAFDGFYASPTLGFRCAIGPETETGAQGAFRINVDEQTPVYQPVDEKTFRSFLSFYKYDKKLTDARVIEVRETPDWRREKLTFSGPSGDQVLAYLYLPQRATKPYQCLLYVPGVNIFLGRNVADDTESILGPQIKAGRAVLTVVLKGATEREWGQAHVQPATSSVQFREEMVRHATELRMGIDYLESRDDIDMQKFAYFGFSWGAGSRLGFAALDNRFRAVILMGAGIDERVKPTLPEADNVNFAPYIKPPKLIVNGKYDEEHNWYTRALPLYNLLPDPKELVLLDCGHLPPVELRTPVINAWLDKMFGPVQFK